MQLRSLSQFPGLLLLFVLCTAGCSKEAAERVSATDPPATDPTNSPQSEPDDIVSFAPNPNPVDAVGEGAAKAFAPFVKLWSVDTDEYDYTEGLSLAPDGKTFAVASSKLQFWKLGEASRLSEIEDFQDVVGLSGNLRAVRYSPDGSRLALGVDSGMLYMWNVVDKKFEFETEAHSKGLKSIAFSPDGKHIATSGFDNKVNAWNAANGEPITAYPIDQDSAMWVTYSGDGKQMAACGEKAIVWNLADGKIVHEYTNEFEVRIASVAFSPDGQSLAIGEMAAQATVLDLTSGIPKVTCTGADGPIDEVIYSTDGKLLVTRVGDYTVRIWDAATGSQLQQIDFADDQNTVSVVGIAWVSDPGLLLIGAQDGDVSVWGPVGTKFSTTATK